MSVSTINNDIYLSDGISINRLCINNSPSKPRKTREKSVAPSKIINTILVIFIVSLDVFSKIFFVNLPCVKAILNEPAAPTAAASEGVAIPKIIEPKTRKIKINGGRIDLNKCMLSSL